MTAEAARPVQDAPDAKAEVAGVIGVASTGPGVIPDTGGVGPSAIWS